MKRPYFINIVIKKSVCIYLAGGKCFPWLGKLMNGTFGFCYCEGEYIHVKLVIWIITLYPSKIFFKWCYKGILSYNLQFHQENGVADLSTLKCATFTWLKWKKGGLHYKALAHSYNRGWIVEEEKRALTSCYNPCSIFFFPFIFSVSETEFFISLPISISAHISTHRLSHWYFTTEGFRASERSVSLCGIKN